MTISYWGDGYAHNSSLRLLIMAVRDLHPSSKLGVGSGWSGPKDLFASMETWPLQWFLQAEILPKTGPHKVWELTGWANIINQGESIRKHNHITDSRGRRNNYAGIYYLTGGCPIQFPHGEINPKESMILLFDADTNHEVAPSLDPESRISIAFNVRAIELPMPFVP